MQLSYTNNTYQTAEGSASLWGKMLPSFSFYSSFLATIYFAAQKAKKGVYCYDEWRLSSIKVLEALERTGLQVSVSGIEHLKSLDSPCVIVGNHVSMMDTVVLPAFVLQERPMTFVIKQSLLDYPVFKHVMRSRDPIALGRTNPREDLKTVMTEGKKRLEQGISVTVFPQTTRGTEFIPQQFNTIGVKLAQRAGVPVLPLALKTDAWTNGRLIKDLGRIHPEVKAHFAFGAPILVEGKGRNEHQQVIDFIAAKLEEWR